MSGQYLRIRRKTQWLDLLEAQRVFGDKEICVEFWLRLPALPERGLTHVLGTPDLGTRDSFNLGVTDTGRVLVSHGTVDFESRTVIVPVPVMGDFAQALLALMMLLIARTWYRKQSAMSARS